MRERNAGIRYPSYRLAETPPNVPNNPIIRNIDNDNYTPICSYEANMYDESYNEGNIVGFKSKSDEVKVKYPIDQGDDP